MSPDRAQTRAARPGDERTNHEDTAPPSALMKTCLKGDCSELHCASLLSTIFATLSRAHQEVSFKQSSTAKKCQLCLNEHDDQYYLMHNFDVQIILSKSKKQNKNKLFRS